MTKLSKILRQMSDSPQNVRYAELKQLCEKYFGLPRQNGSSHAVFKTPWQGDPRVNIQCGSNGMAKPYQVKQVLQAIARLGKD